MDSPGSSCSSVAVSTDFYPPLNLKVITPRLELHGATDELLAQLLPIVRDGVVGQHPYPFDDPMSLYEDNPLRERKWLQAIWRGRGNVRPGSWRLYFVILLGGQAVGMQDLIGVDFDTCRTVTSFSWLAPSARQQGLGREMRAAVLHLAFEGFGRRKRPARLSSTIRHLTACLRAWATNRTAATGPHGAANQPC